MLIETGKLISIYVYHNIYEAEDKSVPITDHIFISCKSYVYVYTDVSLSIDFLLSNCHL